MPPDGFLIVLCTVPDRPTAERVAHGLVEAGFAACVNILPGLASIYRWKGQVETGEELLLLVKCRAAAYGDVESYIKEHHPYELPEVIAVSLAAGSKAYLSWLAHPDNPKNE